MANNRNAKTDTIKMDTVMAAGTPKTRDAIRSFPKIFNMMANPAIIPTLIILTINILSKISLLTTYFNP